MLEVAACQQFDHTRCILGGRRLAGCLHLRRVRSTHVAQGRKDELRCVGFHGGFCEYAVGVLSTNQHVGSFGSKYPLLDVMAPYGGRVGAIAGFAVVHIVLVVLGYALKESVNAPALMWPAVGWLFVTLWMTPRSLWPAILVTQYVIEAVAPRCPRSRSILRRTLYIRLPTRWMRSPAPASPA